MMIQYLNQMKYFDYKTHNKNKSKKSKQTKLCDNIMTFDIEVTSAWIENGKIIGYEPNHTADYWNELKPVCLPYIWQFSCDDIVYYGRDIKDFEKVLKDIPKDMQVIIWVHNLSYEFHFLSDFLDWKTVFARSAHKPMKCVPKKYPNIEFRCSYMLTRLSLDAWGKQIGVHKKTGDLNYDVIRTPLTKLTDTELEYCEYDCRVVKAGIQDYLKRYKTQYDIPLTQTGTVRAVVKNKLMNSKSYSKSIKRLVPHDAEEYLMLRNVFAGGYTHANSIYSNHTVKGLIEHRDFASSYPTVMIAEKYPMTPWVFTGLHEMPNESTFETYAYIIKLKFKHIKSILCNTYIQRCKTECVNALWDNGRLISADECEMYITEQDYITIKNAYSWNSLEVYEVYRSVKDYLPKPLIEYIFELYKNKTELKGIDEMADLYLQSKQYINSLYGMSVTAIVQADIEYDNGEWNTALLTEDYVNERLNKLRFNSPRERRYFMSYSWGVYVTAYARRNLWKCIEYCDTKCIYCDTDSIFTKGEFDFTWYDNEITEKLRKTCEHYNIDFEYTRPKDKHGIEHPLGVFSKEDDCSEFRTLGAKRYVERRVSDGQLHLTVSGINKEAVAQLHDNIENFKNGVEFDKDGEGVKKQLLTYVTDMPNLIWNDGYISTNRCGINMRATGYKLSLSDEYEELLEWLSMSVSELPEGFITSLRARF